MTAVENTDPDLTGYLRPWVIRYTWLVVSIGAAFAVIVLLIAVVRPEVFAKGLSHLQGKERADVLGSSRDFGLKLAAGVGAVTAATLAWGRFELAKEERVVARLTLDAQRLTLDAQRLTGDAERFARAVDQIGSDKGDVVLGGIYALEALANSADAYQSQITEVLSAFVREHVRNRNDTSTSRKQSSRQLTVIEQAALTVLGRNPSWHGRVDLSQASLSDATLSGAYLNSAALYEADLKGATLLLAKLVRADLTGANLTGANLQGANLTEAILTDAQLQGATLLLAHLTGADLTDADLTGADLEDADLTGAELTNADLTGAGLRGAKLSGAKWRKGRDPVLPSGFKPTLLAQGDFTSIAVEP